MTERKLARRGRAIGALAALAIGLGLIPWSAAAASSTIVDANPSVLSTPGLDDVLGDYDSAIRETTQRSDGLYHVDTPATIDALEDMGVNTYAYLVWHEDSDWDDLVTEFLPAAQTAGINVWVYIVPPLEGNSAPFEDDFVTWGEEIASLSLTYSNLKAWAIDDFATDLATFTPAYMDDIMTAADAINPALEFFPILYKRDYSTGFLDNYEDYIDGVIFPYDNYPNYDSTFYDTLEAQLDEVSGMVKPRGLRVYLMPYAARISLAPFSPTGDYIRAVNTIGTEYMTAGDIDGIINYATPKQPVTEVCQPEIDNLQVLRTPWVTPTVGGDSVSVSQTVTPDPLATQYLLDFWQNDSYYPYYAPNEAYYKKQVLVDNVVVWERSGSGNDSNESFEQIPLDLTAELTGKTSATITFRLSNPVGVTNWGFWFMVSHPEATGFAIDDFTVPSSWTTSSTSPAFTAEHMDFDCDPDRQQHILDAISDVFGSYVTPAGASDVTAPAATVKTGASFTVGTDGVYDLVSFKLSDAGKIDKVEINGTVKDLVNNAWSDVNFVKPGTFGAVKGENTLAVFDVAGNTKTVTFTLN